MLPRLQFQLMNSFGNLLTWSSAPQEFASARVQRTAQSCPAIQHAFEYPDGRWALTTPGSQPGGGPPRRGGGFIDCLQHKAVKGTCCNPAARVRLTYGRSTDDCCAASVMWPTSLEALQTCWQAMALRQWRSAALDSQ